MKTPRDDMLDDLRRVKETVGQLPGLDAVNTHSDYELSEFVDEFGSLPAAMEAAGMEIDLFTRSRGLSNQQLINHLKEFADELGDRPSKKQMAEEGPHAPATYANNFGSWTAALEAAGFEPHQARIPDAELKAEFLRLTTELGHPPTEREMNREGQFSAPTYKNRFGSWSATLEAFGHDPHSNLRRVSNEQVLDAIRDLTDELGRPPTAHELNQEGDVSAVLAHQRYGSYSAALQKAGVVPEETQTGVPSRED